MKILSLFDGISCARVALERVGIPIETYYTSEVDKYAIQIAQKNYSDTVQLGSVVGLKVDFQPDLLIGGSPCQDLSIAKKDRKGLDGERSGLFWEYVRILKETKPRWFILENVNSMPKEAKQIISETLGVEPVMINASLVSAQNRKRLFWVGRLVGDKYEQVEIPQPEDRGILLKDILEENVDEKYFLNVDRTKYVLNRPKNFAVKIDPDKTNTLRTNYGNASANETYITTQRVGSLNSGGQGDCIYSPDGKSVGLSALGGGRGAKTGLYLMADKSYCVPSTYYKENIKSLIQRKKKGLLVTEKNSQKESSVQSNCKNNSILPENMIVRKLTPIECERLQGLTEKEQSCIIRVCSGNQNNLVSVVSQNPKSQNAVGNVEKGDLKETAPSAEKSLNTNNPQTKKLAQPDVLINCEESRIEIYNQGKLLASVSGADWKQSVRPLKQIGDFVRLVVGLNTIVERITPFGEAGLPQKSNLLVVKESGNNVVSIFGKGITQLASDAENDLTILNKLLKSITSDHFGQENKEQILITLFSFVVNAILGYIPEKMKNQNTLTFQIKTKVGYTYSVSNTQRYKMLGNAFNVDVVAHILSFITPKGRSK